MTLVDPGLRPSSPALSQAGLGHTRPSPDSVIQSQHDGPHRLLVEFQSAKHL
jgi:hypothetical protein